MTPAVAVLALALAGSLAQDPAPGEAGSARDFVFFAEDRPVFLRIRVRLGDEAFESQWIHSVELIHKSLDRDGDGKLTTKEATPETSSPRLSVLRSARRSRFLARRSTSIPRTTSSRSPSLPIGSSQSSTTWLQAGRQVVGRTDALFDQLDRDKDGQLTRLELAAIAGSLRPLDLDDNEMISADELSPFNSPAETAMEDNAGVRSSFSAQPSVVELVAGESSLRSARLLLKKYDKGKEDVPGRPDGKLSPEEFAIDRDAFSHFDRNHDGALDTEDLRRVLAHPPFDLTLDVALPKDGERAAIRVERGSDLPKDAKIRQLANGDVEIALGKVRVDFHVDDRAIGDDLHRLFGQRFKAFDTNKNGYLEDKELAAINAQGSPFAGLPSVIDRDADGKLYLKELIDFVDGQFEAARLRLVLNTSDQGRAIFGILDRDRDRRLGTREVMGTVDRVISWDSDGDGRVSADEIPYHFMVTIARGSLPGLLGAEIVVPRTRPATWG